MAAAYGAAAGCDCCTGLRPTPLLAARSCAAFREAASMCSATQLATTAPSSGARTAGLGRRLAASSSREGAAHTLHAWPTQQAQQPRPLPCPLIQPSSAPCVRMAVQQSCARAVMVTDCPCTHPPPAGTFSALPAPPGSRSTSRASGRSIPMAGPWTQRAPLPRMVRPLRQRLCAAGPQRLCAAGFQLAVEGRAFHVPPPPPGLLRRPCRQPCIQHVR